MKYYELYFDDFGETPYWHISIDERRLESNKGDIWALSNGQRCTWKHPWPCVVSDTGVEADYNIDALTTVPIVSDRLAQFMTEVAPNDMELVPVALDAPGSWWAMNVLPIVDAIDFKNSVISFHDADHPKKAGKPRGVMRLIVTPDALNGHHLARLKDWKIAIIASESVKMGCQKRGMTNMKFIPATVPEWNAYAIDTKDDRWCFRPWREK